MPVDWSRIYVANTDFGCGGCGGKWPFRWMRWLHCLDCPAFRAMMK